MRGPRSGRGTWSAGLPLRLVRPWVTRAGQPGDLLEMDEGTTGHRELTLPGVLCIEETASSVFLTDLRAPEPWVHHLRRGPGLDTSLGNEVVSEQRPASALGAGSTEPWSGRCLCGLVRCLRGSLPAAAEGTHHLEEMPLEAAAPDFRPGSLSSQKRLDCPCC